MIAEILASTRKLLAERRDAAERAAIAKAFNDRYCYRREYVESHAFLPGNATCLSGYRWMCPSCNQIHAPTECSVWVGLHYPPCCATPAGHRLHAQPRIRTS